MKLNWYGVFSLLLYCLTSTFVFADTQERFLQSCGLLLNNGMRQIEEKFGSTSTLDTLYYDFCQINIANKSSDKNASFGFAVEGTPWSAKGSDKTSKQSRDEFCGQYKTSQASTRESYSYTNSIYSKSLEAWERCLTLASHQIEIKPDIAANQKSMSVFLAYAGLGEPGIVFQGVDTIGKIKCESGGKSVGPDENVRITSAGVTLTCRREGIQSDVGGITSTLYDDSRVVIKTNVAQLAVDFDVMIDDPAAGQLRNQQAQINSLNEKLKQTDNKFDGLELKTVCLARNQPSCKAHSEAVQKLTCPTSFKDTGLREYNYFSGGSCGKGNGCIVCGRFKNNLLN